MVIYIPVSYTHLNLATADFMLHSEYMDSVYSRKVENFNKTIEDLSLIHISIYVILGGYMATAINDFIQGVIMLIGIVVVIAAVLGGKGGFLNAVQTMAEIPSDVPITQGQPGAFTSFFGPDPINLLGVVILTSLGTWGLPQMINKFYAIKDEKAINTGTVISTLFAVVVAGGSYFLGGFGRLFDNPAIHDKTTGAVVYDSIVPFMLSALPDILIGIVVVLVLSASMSTLSSLVLTSSSTMTLDLLKDNVIKKMSEKRQVVTDVYKRQVVHCAPFQKFVFLQHIADCRGAVMQVFSI